MFAIIRALIMLTGTVTGVTFGFFLGDEPAFISDPTVPSLLGDNPQLILAVVIGMLGYLIASLITRELEEKLNTIFSKINFKDITAGSIGFLAGLLTANLIIILPALFIYNSTSTILPGFLQPVMPIFKFFVPLILNLFFGYIGMTVVAKHRREILNFIKGKDEELSINNYNIYIDTSILIDGRIVEIIDTGFLYGNLLVPKFVLNELHILSDSSDEIKRNRGRRGLKITEDLQKLYPDNVRIITEDIPEVVTVDEKLIKIAQKNQSIILTNDYNLNKVANIQSIKVLNLNELVKSLKPVVMPGEELSVYILKSGKEECQGVGYLPDGTMIVVEDGGEFVGKEMTTTVTSMIQTSAGRMIFTRVDQSKNNIFDLNEKRKI